MVEGKKCGRPIYMNNVCNRCWAMNETLRGEYNPMRANAAAESMDRSGFERLHVEDDTLDKKMHDREVSAAMKRFDEDIARLLGGK